MMLEQAKEALPEGTEIRHGLAKVSLVGAGMATHSGVAAKALAALFEKGINHYQITTSEISMSIMIDRDMLQSACDTLTKACLLYTSTLVSSLRSAIQFRLSTPVTLSSMVRWTTSSTTQGILIQRVGSVPCPTWTTELPS